MKRLSTSRRLCVGARPSTAKGPRTGATRDIGPSAQPGDLLFAFIGRLVGATAPDDVRGCDDNLAFDRQSDQVTERVHTHLVALPKRNAETTLRGDQRRHKFRLVPPHRK